MYIQKILLYSTVALIAGCGDGVKIAPVEGTVTLDGKPLDKVMVEFWPDAVGPRSFGETDSQGHFKLTTDDGKSEGAAIGLNRVTLKDLTLMGDKFMGREAEHVNLSEGKKPRISAKLAQTESTPISETVVAGKKNEFTIKATK
jgi:hypothetical protein